MQNDIHFVLKNGQCHLCILRKEGAKDLYARYLCSRVDRVSCMQPKDRSMS